MLCLDTMEALLLRPILATSGPMLTLLSRTWDRCHTKTNILNGTRIWACPSRVDSEDQEEPNPTKTTRCHTKDSNQARMWTNPSTSSSWCNSSNSSNNPTWVDKTNSECKWVECLMAMEHSNSSTTKEAIPSQWWVRARALVGSDKARVAVEVVLTTKTRAARARVTRTTTQTIRILTTTRTWEDSSRSLRVAMWWICLRSSSRRASSWRTWDRRSS